MSNIPRDCIQTRNTIASRIPRKMKLVLILVALASASAGRLDHLTGGGANVGEATRFENVNDGAGTYHFSYETPNGISARESGSPRAAGAEGPAVTAEGAFSYRTPDGQQISLTYTADENGFHPVGSHLPTPPPIPEAILKALEFNRQNPSSDDGSYNGGRNAFRF